MKNKPQVNLIDKSDTQLKLALEFLDLLAIPLNTYKKKDFKIHDFTCKGLAVFSYLLCEQDSNTFLEDLFKYRKNFRNGFAIIDYKENIKKIYNCFKQFEDSRKISIVLQTYKPSKRLSTILKEDEVKVYGFFYRP